MRILVINPFGGTEFRGHDNLERIKRPDTEFEMVNIAADYPLRNNQWLYFKHACTGPTLEKVMWAEKEGYDGVFISCQLDIGLYEARTLVDIPVTGTLESAALFSYTMGKHFTLLAVDGQNGEIQRDLLRQYGLDRNLASIIPIHIDANDLYPERTSEDSVFERVIAAGKLARERDGAEMVIPGCTLFGSLLSHRRQAFDGEVGIPSVDGMTAGFKLAEMRAELYRKGAMPAVSRAGYFVKPPRADFQTLRAFDGKPDYLYGDPASSAAPKDNQARKG
jgi:allantoin racemase